MAVERIASLLASSTEILYGLGLGERIVAVSHECDYPPDAATKPRVTSTRVDAAASSRDIDEQVRGMSEQRASLYEIDVPRLAELRPDLIVTQAQCDVCAVRYEDVLAAVAGQPELRGAEVVALNPHTLEDIFADIRRVGRAAQRDDEADAFIAALQARVEAVRTKAAGLPAERRPRVLAIEWIDPIMVAGNWTPAMIEIAGGVNCLASPGAHSPYVDWSAVRREDAEVVIIMPCGFDLRRTLTEARLLTELPGWGDLAAARRGAVFAVDGNAYFNRSGPRMVDSLEILGRLIHPELFRESSIAEHAEVWRPLVEG